MSRVVFSFVKTDETSINCFNTRMFPKISSISHITISGDHTWLLDLFPYHHLLWIPSNEL